MHVSTYFGKLNSLWEELYKHEPLISSTCCSSCDARFHYESHRDTQTLRDFLMGLHLDCAPLRSSILSTDPLPSLDCAYHLVVQDERVCLADLVVEDQPTVVLGFVAQSAGVGRGHGCTPPPTCTHCHKQGHEASSCWSFIPWFHCKIMAMLLKIAMRLLGIRMPRMVTH